MILVQKIIRGLTTRIEDQFKSMNELYRYSTQNDPCFSNFIFSQIPSLCKSSNLINDILMASEISINSNNTSGNEILVFEHFLDYAVNCLDPIIFDFYSNNSFDSNNIENKNIKKKEDFLFFDIIRLNFYTSILSILTSQKNIKYLTFTPSMYSSFLQKFPDFFTNNIGLALDINEHKKPRYLYHHYYNSIQNIFNSLSRFKIDIFKNYIQENDSKKRSITLSKICDAAVLLVQNEQSLQSFTKDLTMMLGINITNIEKSDFLDKLFQFFMHLFITNSELYQKVITSGNAIVQNIHVFFVLILQLLNIDPNSAELTLPESSYSEISKMLPILCFALPFLYENPNFEKYKNFVFDNLKSISERLKNFISSCSKETIFDYLNSFIALFQSTLLIPDSQTTISSIVDFVNMFKPDFDTFLFKCESKVSSVTNDDNVSSSLSSINLSLQNSNPYFEIINSTLFLKNILPRYLALDIAKASKDYDESSSNLYNITQSVSFCTQSSNIYCSSSLIHGLLLLMKGYPLKKINPIAVQIILNIVINVVSMYKNPSSSSSPSPSASCEMPSPPSSPDKGTNSSSSSKENSYSIEAVDHLHRDIFELISGHSFYSSGDSSNEYELNPTFLDLISSENSTSLAFYHFIINELRSNFLVEMNQKTEKQLNVSDFSSETIASFFILLNAVFDKPSRWTIFTLESTNTNRFFKFVNIGLYKLYKDLLRKNVTNLFCFNTIIIKYLNFAKEIIKISKNKVAIDDFIDSVEKILLLMNATLDETNTEILNKELQKFANEFNVPFFYQWPIKHNLTKQVKISPEKLKKMKDNVILPIMKFCYFFWFDSSLQYLIQNDFMPLLQNTETNNNYQVKSTIPFQIIIRLSSFLCKYSFFIDDAQPLLIKNPIFKNAKIKFANAFLDFISHDIKDEVSNLISNSITLLDINTSNMMLKILRSNLLSSASSFSFSSSFISLIPNNTAKLATNDNCTNSFLILHPNCYMVVSELINEECVFYNDQSYKMCEEIILNLITIICMDKKFKSNNNDDASSLSIKSILYSMSSIIYKFYSFSRKDAKTSQIARLSIISTILNYMISTQNSMFSVIISKPLPQLFKDFVITAENELSRNISDYHNLIFIRKTIDKFFSFFFLILSSNDKSSLFSVCQESLENILVANYKEGIDIFATSLLNYSKSDFFSTAMIKSFISISKKSPEIIKNYFSCLKSSNSKYAKQNQTFSKLNIFRDGLNNSSFSLIIESNINSIYFYDAVIEACSYQNKLLQLFTAMCSKYQKSDEINDSNFYEKINSPFFFISFFKIAATQSFINSFSVSLFKMSVEKTTENLLPPIQFVYYWQLFAKLTKEDPFVVLDKFFIRPILLQPHLYKINPLLAVKMNQSATNAIVQCTTFIKKLRQHLGMILYLDHLMKDQIEYFEVYPNNTDQFINSQSVLFHFLCEVPHPGNFITFSNVSFDKNSIDIPSDISKFALARIVFEFIESQCFVCIDKDRKKNENWLLCLDKVPEKSIPFIHECLRVLITKTIEEKDSKKNVFSTFYEESSNTTNQGVSVQSSSTDLILLPNSTSNKNAEPNVKLTKRRFSKSIFKLKPHNKKGKDDEKNKTKSTDVNYINNNNNNNNNNSIFDDLTIAIPKEEDDSFLSQINLYVNMRKLPSNYLHILEIIFAEKIKSINLIFTPIGILHEIETNIINKQQNNRFNHVKVISNVDKEEGIILPYHISETKIHVICKVNNNPGSIGFFQEYIVISSFENFRGQQCKVSTVSTYTIFRLPKIISKTAIEILFQADQNMPPSLVLTHIQGKKVNSIILDFDLNNNNESKTVVKVSPEFAIEAIQSSTGSTIGDKKVMSLPLSINSDPTIALTALSLFYIPSTDSTVSESSIELFWDIIKLLNNQTKQLSSSSSSSLSSSSFSKNSASITNSLSLPLDGFIHVIQGIHYNNGCKESNLFSSVVQFIAPIMSIYKQESISMSSFLTLIYAFLSSSNDQSVLSGVCHNLLLRFKATTESNSNEVSESNKKSCESSTNNHFQLLHIWSNVRSQSFTAIALPQILVYVQSSACQSQLIHCLTAKNRKAVNEILIENLLYKDLVSFRLYSSICSNGFFKIFPSFQFLGRPEIILFLSLVVALTSSKEMTHPFTVSMKSFYHFYKKNKQLISQQNNEAEENVTDDLNDDENDNLYSLFVDFNNDNDESNDSKSVTSLFTPENFDPEKSNIYMSAKQILTSFDETLKDSVFNLFDLLTKKENSNIWYLKPSLSTFELLEVMTESIVPELNLKKLNFCIATFKKHESDMFSLFWVALPYLLSQYKYLRRLSVEFIAFIFKRSSKKNNEIMKLKNKGENVQLIDPFDEFMKILNSDKNLQHSVRAFGEAIGANFEENLPIALASVLIGFVLRDENLNNAVIKLISDVCKSYRYQPQKAFEFVLILIVYTGKVNTNFIQKFNLPSINQNTKSLVAISEFLKATASLKSKFEILWALNFLVWSFSQKFNDSKYQIFTIVIYEILKARTDVTRIIKDEIISRFLSFTDSKDASIQDYLAYIFAIANSTSKEDGENDNDQSLNVNNNSSNSQKANIIDQLKKLLWDPKPHNLVEQHLYSFCVNFQAAIQNVVKSKV